MSGNSNIVKFSLLIALLVIIFFAYRFFFAGAPESSPAMVGLAPAGVISGGEASDEFFALLLGLREIDLSDMARVSLLLSGLQDFSTALEPQAPGRANPFAPLGAGGGYVETATSSVSNATTTTTATTTR